MSNQPFMQHKRYLPLLVLAKQGSSCVLRWPLQQTWTSCLRPPASSPSAYRMAAASSAPSCIISALLKEYRRRHRSVIHPRTRDFAPDSPKASQRCPRSRGVGRSGRSGRSGRRNGIAMSQVHRGIVSEVVLVFASGRRCADWSTERVGRCGCDSVVLILKHTHTY